MNRSDKFSNYHLKFVVNKSCLGIEAYKGIVAIHVTSWYQKGICVCVCVCVCVFVCVCLCLCVGVCV